MRIMLRGGEFDGGYLSEEYSKQAEPGQVLAIRSAIVLGANTLGRWVIYQVHPDGRNASHARSAPIGGEFIIPATGIEK